MYIRITEFLSNHVPCFAFKPEQAILIVHFFEKMNNL